MREKAAQPGWPTFLEVVRGPHLEGFSTGFCGLSMESTLQEPRVASVGVLVAMWGPEGGGQVCGGEPHGLWGP